jgi:hypothetical protein
MKLRMLNRPYPLSAQTPAKPLTTDQTIPDKPTQAAMPSQAAPTMATLMQTAAAIITLEEAATTADGDEIEEVEEIGEAQQTPLLCPPTAQPPPRTT